MGGSKEAKKTVGEQKGMKEKMEIKEIMGGRKETMGG
jgi:hypothetical protein